MGGVGEPSGEFFAEGGAFGDGGGEAEECAAVLLSVPAGGDEVGCVAHGVAGYVGEVFAEGADEDGVAVAEGEAADEDVGYAGEVAAAVRDDAGVVAVEDDGCGKPACVEEVGVCSEHLGGGVGVDGEGAERVK